MSSDVELLPCPFCGSPAHLNTIRTSDKEFIRLNGRDTGYGVNCEQCGTTNRGFAYGWRTVEKAVEHWNTRANLAALQAENERLRAEVENWEAPCREFLDKTQWVQDTAKPYELGLHRADVLRQRIEQAYARAERLAEVLREYRLPLTGDYKHDVLEFGHEAVAREERRRAALAEEDRA